MRERDVKGEKEVPHSGVSLLQWSGATLASRQTVASFSFPFTSKVVVMDTCHFAHTIIDTLCCWRIHIPAHLNAEIILVVTA